MRNARSRAFGIRAAFHHGSQVPQTVAGFLLEQREEQIFLAVEVGVKSAARVAGGARDILNPRCFESVPGKNPPGRVQQSAPRGLGSLLVLGLFAVSWRLVTPMASYIIYMQVCI